jgi:hypothetical protein
VKYDDASWHYGGNFAEDLPPEAGATHIAMFLAWAAGSNLLGDLHTDEDPELLVGLLARSMTPGCWFITACDEKFTEEDLNAEGNAFAAAYYVEAEAPGALEPKYLADYCNAFPEFGDVYRVPDSWESFERLKPLLDKRYADWKSPKPRGWRRFFQ